MNPPAASLLPRVVTAALTALLAALVVSCGGGGAASPPTPTTGSLAIAPGSATLYAGVPYEITIAGGRRPYLVTSSEPTIVALNRTVDANAFTIVANNPGVIDPNAGEGEVPRRSVTVTVRDSLGATVSAQYSVLQNFFTGYRQVYSNTCASDATAGTVDACAGTDSLIQLVPVSQGSLFVNRELRLDRVRGDFAFVNENPAANPQTVDRLFVRTDGTGRALARLRVSPLAPSQLATYTITDVATGASTTVAFVIVATSITIPKLELLPPGPITFVGRSDSLCGGGFSDLFIVGGRPPYTVGASIGVAFTPAAIQSSGGRLTVSIDESGAPCPPPFTVLVTDRAGDTVTFTINSVPGGAGAAPPPVVIAPATLPGAAPALKCGQSAQVAVIGGSTRASLSVRSTHPRVNGIIDGSTLRVQRITGDGVTVYPDAFTVTVTDGNTTATLDGTTATNCP